MASRLTVSPGMDGCRLAFVDELGDARIEVTTPAGNPLTFASPATAWRAVEAANTAFDGWLASIAERSTHAKQKDAH